MTVFLEIVDRFFGLFWFDFIFLLAISVPVNKEFKEMSAHAQETGT